MKKILYLLIKNSTVKEVLERVMLVVGIVGGLSIGIEYWTNRETLKATLDQVALTSEQLKLAAHDFERANQSEAYDWLQKVIGSPNTQGVRLTARSALIELGPEVALKPILDILTGDIEDSNKLWALETSSALIVQKILSDTVRVQIVVDSIWAVAEQALRLGAKYGMQSPHPIVFSPRLNLSGSRLERVYLKKFGFNEINISNSNLRGANLTETKLTSADLSFCDLSKSVANKANLKYAILKGANLSGSQLKNADLSYAIFEEANLQNANLSRALMDSANLYHANLKNTDLRGAKGILPIYLATAQKMGARLDTHQDSISNVWQKKYPNWQFKPEYNWWFNSEGHRHLVPKIAKKP